MKVRSERPRPSEAMKIHALLVLVLLGILLGVSSFTLQYAEGLSYFSANPGACANCHIMQPRFDSWQKSSHHGVATCVDCHLPHHFVGKYLAKAENGYHHSKGFTMQDFPEPIVMKEKNARIVQENCLACHGDLTEHMVYAATYHLDAVRCVHCHAGVGHGERASLGGPAEEELPERESR